REGPKAGLRSGPAQQHIAAAVEGLAGVVGACIECAAVTRTDRQFAGARDHRARIGVDAGGPVLRPSGPGPDGNAAVGAAPGQRDPGPAKADRRRDYECKHGSEEQTHVWSASVAVRATGVAKAAPRPQSPRD